MEADKLNGWDNLPMTFSDNPENAADNSFVPDRDAEASTGNKDHTGTRRRTTACITHSDRYHCGRVAVFRNHSKIMTGDGEKFPFALESSANINTNPRTEQTQVTVNDKLYHFYKDYFDGIISIDKKADTK